MTAFYVLGPLEVRSGDEVMPIRAAKRRILLACLLLRANRVVPVDELVDHMWPSSPPLNVRNALHKAVSVLRDEIGPDVLISRPGGYLVSVGADELDLLRLHELGARAAAAAQSGDLLAEADALDAALQLWRGDELVDVPSERLHADLVPALREQRLSLLERRADAWLRLGRHDQLIAELAALTQRYPLRERFWAQRIRALFHAGRQGEALEVYRCVAALLADELGVDPGVELRTLHAQVLSGRLDDDGPAGRGRTVVDDAAPPAAAVPHELPPDVSGFTGRDRELDELLRLHTTDERTGGHVVISAIDGIAGVGKSALAITAAHRLAHHYPDGQLYANLRGATARSLPVEPIQVLGRFLRSLGADGREVPTELDEATTRFRSLLTGRRVLVVLDDARSAAQVRPLLPASPGCAVLVTSRGVLASLEGVHHVHLDVLSAAQARDLLGRMAGERRVSAEPESAARICELCGYLPLALRIAGARLAARPNWPLHVLVEKLGDARSRLDELHFGELAVRSSFHVTYESLLTSEDPEDRDAAQAFRLLGLPDGPDIGVPIAARLLDLAPADAGRTLERLVDAQLLTSPSPGRYQLHDLVRLFARETALATDSEEARHAALDRVWRCYVATARELIPLTRFDRSPEPTQQPDALPLASRTEALAWAEVERANIVAAAYQASARPAPDPTVTIQLASAFFPFLHNRAYWHEARALSERALEVAQRCGQHDAIGQILNDLARVSFRLLDFDTSLAHLKRSLEVRRAAGDRDGEAKALANLGVLQVRLGDVAAGIASHQASLALSGKDDDGYYRAAVTLNNLAFGYLRLGDTDAAVELARELLETCRARTDRLAEAIAQATLGEAYVRAGQPAEAIPHLEESASRQRSLGYSAGENEAFAWLCEAYRLAGRMDDALDVGRRAVALCRRSGTPYEEAIARLHLGNALADAGRRDLASVHWQRAIRISDKLARGDAEFLRAQLTANGWLPR